MRPGTSFLACYVRIGRFFDVYVVLSPRISPSVITVSLRCYACLWFILAVRASSACAHRSPRRQCPISCVVHSFGFFLSFVHFPASQHPDAVRSPVKQSSGLCPHSTAKTPRIPSRSPFFNIATNSLALDTLCGSPPMHQQIRVTSLPMLFPNAAFH